MIAADRKLKDAGCAVGRDGGTFEGSRILLRRDDGGEVKTKACRLAGSAKRYTSVDKRERIFAELDVAGCFLRAPRTPT